MRKSSSLVLGLLAASALLSTSVAPAQADSPSIAPAADWAGPLAPDQPVAKSFDTAASVFAATSTNPMTKWEYRVWCQTGYHAADEAGTGQPVDLPAPDPRRDLVTPLGFQDTANEHPLPNGGVKFMDNAWAFGDDHTGLIVIRTPDRDLLVFDALTTPEDARTLFLSQAKSAGLDLRRITTIFVGHEHGDHYGGVDTIKKAYAKKAKVVMSQTAADTVRERREQLIEHKADYTPTEYKELLAALPKKIDKTVKPFSGLDVGTRTFRAGGVNVTAVLAPGHTPGQMHFIVPVVHQGSTKTLLVWSGNDNLKQAGQYAVSTEFVAGVAKKLGADAFINTHFYQLAQFAYLRDLKADPKAANPFLMGTTGVQQHLAVFALCQRALEQRVIDGTWKKM